MQAHPTQAHPTQAHPTQAHPTQIAYYAELDPYTGSVPATMAALPRLIDELTILCLLHDAVHLPPGHLLHHPLALLAFEALSPLVIAAHLGTTIDATIHSPATYVQARLERGQAAGTVSRDLAQRIEDRWRCILPDAWSDARAVGAQVAAHDELLATSLRALPARDLGQRLLDAIDRERQAGRRPKRPALFAYLGALRGYYSPRDLGAAAALVQSTYFLLGARFHSDQRDKRCRLFPGAFFRRLPGLDPSGMIPPGSIFNPALNRSAIATRAAAIGLDLDRLVAMPPRDLLALTRAPEWWPLAAVLRGEAAPLETTDGLRDRLLGHDLRDALHRASGGLTPAVVPSRWQLGAQATLGSTLSERQPTAYELAWPTRILSNGERAHTLSRAEAQLISLLALSGEAGLSERELHQALREIDRLEAQPAPAGPANASDAAALRWPPPPARSAHAQAFRNRLHVATHHLRALLEPLGLGLTVAANRWRLTAPVRLRETPWELRASAVGPSTALPVPLSPGLAAFWQALAEAWPCEVRAERLLAALGREDDDAGRRAVSRAVYRLRQRLAQHDAHWTVHSDRRGGYRLARPPGASDNTMRNSLNT